MGQRPRELTPNASPWHHLGSEMRTWREQRRMSLGKLGQKIRFNPSYMARAERGDQRPSADLVTAYDHALDAGGSLVRNYRRIRESESPHVSGPDHVSKTGLHVANGHVALAEEMDAAGPSSEGISVPVRTDDGRIIFVSLSRRTLLTGLGTAAALSASPELAAAASTAPPPAFSGMNPVEHLKATRQVLIDNDNLFGAHQVIPVVQRQITAMKALRGELRGADRRALLQLQTQYAELCGWLHQDTGDFRASQHWMREALETSHMAGDPDLTTFILARRSQLAGDMRDPIEAVDIAEAAEDMATPGSRLAATAATYGAHGHALRGEPEAAKRAYDHAHELRESLDADPESPWAVWLDTAYIEVQRAHSLALLGDHQAAAEGFRAAITQLPAGYHRDRGVYLAREAVAYAEAGEAEQAATVGRHALNIGIDTGSARISRELGHLDGLLNQWRSVPSVTEFQDAMNDAVFRQV